MIRPRFLPHAALCFALAACSSAADENGAPAPPAPSSPSTDPPEFAPETCAHLEGAAPNAMDPNVQLSRTFALARWFGIAADGDDVDVALQDSVENAAALDAFATAVSGCTVPNASALGEATTVLEGDVAIIRPGRGDVVVPDGAKAIAIDLRGLPSGAELEGVLGALAPVVLVREHAWPTTEEVRCQGLPDEVFAPGPGKNVYGCKVEKAEALPKSTGSAPARPLAVITGPRLAPEAAMFALSLRLANEAWLVGENVLAEVAEMTGASGPSKTAYVRTHVLSRSGSVVPDLVAADHRTTDSKEWLRSLPGRGSPPPVEASQAERSTKVAPPTISQPASPEAAPAATRAALVSAHAAARTFFPYFGVIQDTWDAAFLKASNEATNVKTARDQVLLLREMGAALEDGHQFVYSKDPASFPAGYAALAIDVVGTDVLVVRSQVSGIERGDRIVAVDGRSAAEIRAEALVATSGSPGRRRSAAALRLLELDAKATFELERAGTTKSVTVSPAKAPLAESPRPPGDLADLGAADTYYVSLDAAALEGKDVGAIAAQAKQHRALVLDMRGYPGAESWTLAGFLLPPEAKGCELRVATVSRRGELSRDLEVQTMGAFGGGAADPFTGPIAMLIGNDSQSSAEHLAFFFANGNYAKLVGRPSSGANGNITGIQAPGGLIFSFTGMEVRHPGGGRFHGLGLQPDVAVEPTRADITAGVDTVLAKAIDVVKP